MKREAHRKIIMIYPSYSSFIEKDVKLLSADFSIIHFNFNTSRKVLTPFKLLHQLFFILYHYRTSDIILCQFAGYHSFLPALFSKFLSFKTVVSIGGNDGHFFPKLGYGNYTKKLLGWFTSKSLLWCTHVLPKHSSLIDSTYTYDNEQPHKQGIKNFIPGFKTPFTVVENGYDSLIWYRKKEKTKKSFVTICGGLEYHFQFQLKGIDLFVEAAKKFSDSSFTLIGAPKGYSIKNKPENLEILGSIKNSDLPEVLSAFTFYVQLSMAEGFPNSLCEAMLCECIPIGSSVFSIPEIIGNNGYILKKREAEELFLLIQKALIDVENGNRTGTPSRNRISEFYTEKKRKEKLLQVFREL